jgi:hypothetical protein
MKVALKKNKTFVYSCLPTGTYYGDYEKKNLQNLVNLGHFFPMKVPVYIGPNHILEVKFC